MRINIRCYRSLLPVLLLGITVRVDAAEFHVDGFGTASLSCFSSDTTDYVAQRPA
jgi:hypothetical protein